MCMYKNNVPLAIILNSPEKIAPVAEDAIIVADGGLRHLDGKTPIAVIGDFDSLGYVPNIPNVEIITHPVKKDATDGELAIDYAIKKGFTNVVLYGVNGGRIDQILGNVNLLAYARKHGISAIARTQNEEIYFTDGELEIDVNVGDVISVLPYGGEATITASGLYYPLERLTIPAYSSRGISNKAVATVVSVRAERGEIIVVRNYSR